MCDKKRAARKQGGEEVGKHRQEEQEDQEEQQPSDDKSTNSKTPIFFNNPLLGLFIKSLPDNLRPRLDRFQDFKERQNFASMQAILMLVKSFKWGP